MDVARLYINIDHEEGAEACLSKWKTTKVKMFHCQSYGNLMFLGFLIFSGGREKGCIGNEWVKGTAVGTTMTINLCMTLNNADLYMNHLKDRIIDGCDKEQVICL